MAKSDEMMVYFDGGCPVCSREIGFYQKRTRENTSICWVDVRAAPDQVAADLSRAAAMAQFHVRTVEGALLSGVPAFVALWQVTPGLAWLAWVARLPGVTPLLALGYAGFLRVRPLWTART